MTELFSILMSFFIGQAAFAGGAGVGGGGDMRMKASHAVESFNQMCVYTDLENQPLALCGILADSLADTGILCESELPREAAYVQLCRKIGGKPLSMRGTSNFLCRCGS